MTRGTIYFITDKYILETTEFNGSMYPEECGNGVIERLSNVNSIKDFKNEIKDFNKKNHDYDSQLFYPIKRSTYISEETIVMKDYFKNFFSDWTFWKNCSSKTITFKTRDGKEIILEPSEQVAINFGREAGHFKTPKLETQDA